MSYVIVEGVKLAYRDEGHGAVVVFVHGTPSSSAEFAELFARLRTSFRCVALDHLGFGESDKPASADYSIGAHRARTLSRRVAATSKVLSWSGPRSSTTT